MSVPIDTSDYHAITCKLKIISNCSDTKDLHRIPKFHWFPWKNKNFQKKYNAFQSKHLVNILEKIELFLDSEKKIDLILDELPKVLISARLAEKELGYMTSNGLYRRRKRESISIHMTKEI